MAITKKGSRSIVVDGIAYRWTTRRRPTYSQGLAETTLTFAVEDATAPGTTLVVRTTRPHLANYLGLPSYPILPRDVEDAVRGARARGWEPRAKGSPFRMELEAAKAVAA